MSTINDAFSIFLQKGIVGGFAPPTPNAIYTITHAQDSDVFTITTQVRPHGTPGLPPPTAKEVKLADYAEDIVALRDLLRDLPPQYPGAADLYGRNTSVLFQSSGAVDFARIPRGSGAGSGVLRPDEAQIGQFDRAVGIIEGLVAA